MIEFIIGMMIGIFGAYNVEKTKLYGDCKRGDVHACKVIGKTTEELNAKDQK